MVELIAHWSGMSVWDNESPANHLVNARTILAYLFGRREAILEVAANRAALWTGIVLVLLTSIARNYDQTHVTEKPFLWLFGSLLFSLVSGTWVMWGSIGGFAIKEMDLSETERKTWLQWWPQFMGLFWMTAPIAWLYAIPVERFLDSLNATRANIALLIIVSLWRVALMARVFQVLFGIRYLLALAWVLVPAAGEVFLLTGLGGLGQALARGMGGMRNAPEEDLILQVVGVAFWGSIGLIFIAALMATALQPKEYIQGFPPGRIGRAPWRELGFLAVLWIGIAIVPQIELSRNVKVERFMRDENHRAAVDYLNSVEPGVFAPARPLPPKPYEVEVFRELPEFFGVLRPTDKPWVRDHFMRRLGEMSQHRILLRTYLYGDQGVAAAWVDIIEGLERLPGGIDYLEGESKLLATLAEEASREIIRAQSDSPLEAAYKLQEMLENHGITNKARRIELGHEPAPMKPENGGTR